VVPDFRFGINLMNGESAREWQSPMFAIDQNGPLPDVTSISPYIPVVSKRFRSEIGDQLEGGVEFLEMDAEGFEKGSWFILNPLEIVDCIDLTKSDVSYSKDGERFLVRYPAIFLQEFEFDHEIFVPLGLGKWPVLTDRFRELVESASLVGLDFSERIQRQE
jgi:hypothetical protein